MITVLAGTNRPDSFTRKVAKIVEHRLGEQGEQTQFLDLLELPRDLFLPENYWNPPATFEPFQRMITNTDGVIIVTPEYNGSFPGVFKYFFDFLKFPESFRNTPVGFIGVAAGIFGALRSIEQLEMIFHYRNARLFNRRVLFPKVQEKLNAEGTEITDAFTKNLFDQYLVEFPKFVRRNAEG